MKYYSSSGQPRTHVIQLDPEDDLLASVNDFIAASGLRNGVVVSGIGTLKNCTMHMVTTTGYPPVEVFPERNDEALELTSMQGVIADGTPHIHMNVSTQHSAVGGHLEPGCTILYLGEVVVLEFADLELTRVPGTEGIMKLVSARQDGASADA